VLAIKTEDNKTIV